MEYYVGLDISLRSCALCIVDTKGNVILERELACEVDGLCRKVLRCFSIALNLPYVCQKSDRQGFYYDT